MIKAKLQEILNIESRRLKKAKRFSWYPKLGLGSLTEDCLGVHLQKSSTARWQGLVFDHHHITNRERSCSI